MMTITETNSSLRAKMSDTAAEVMARAEQAAKAVTPAQVERDKYITNDRRQRSLELAIGFAKQVGLIAQDDVLKNAAAFEAYLRDGSTGETK